MPFGQERDVNLTSTETTYNLNFTNKELDRDLELNYFGARYYHPELPRFISPDPVSGKLAIPLSWTRYLYCRNDPINLYDPTGKAANPAGMGDMPQDNLTGDVLWVEAYAPPPYSPDNLTIQVGAFSSGGAISGGNTSSGKIYSSNSDTGWGETGTYVTGGGGSFLGLSYSTGMEISISGNAHPEDVSGEVLELGGSVGIGPGVGVSVSCPLDDFANIILTFSFGYNVGALLEGHAFVNNTTVKVTESHTFHRQEGAE